MTDLEKAEQRIAELEAVCLVAHDALQFLFTFLSQVDSTGREQGYVLTHPDWMGTALMKAEIALAATKHRRV